MTRYCLGADTYRVHSAYNGLRVERNGARWLESTSPVVVRFEDFGATPLRLRINADRPGRLTLCGLTPGASVHVLSGAATPLARAGRDGCVTIAYDVSRAG